MRVVELLLILAPVGVVVGFEMIVIGAVGIVVHRMFKEDDDE